MDDKIRVLYLTNIPVPYRVRMFNELAKFCDLTVLYEREYTANRNSNWTHSEIMQYKYEYLGGIAIRGEYAVSFRIFQKLFKEYEVVIIGCYNSPVQMIAILIMRMFNKPYVVNTDGEIFIDKKSFKTKIKNFFLSGAELYITAGEKSVGSLKTVAGKKLIVPYYFSSLSKEELKANANTVSEKRNDVILVIGQYFEYKGLDVVVEVARKNDSLRYKFVGMGKRTELFMKEQCTGNLSNIEVIPFLSKQELEKEYLECAMLLLPSRQECWGLVVNEAASFGMPIVSTWGSGAAVEFLADKYPQYLAVPGDADSLYKAICCLIQSEKKSYSEYLIEKSKKYNIEHSSEIIAKYLLHSYRKTVNDILI